MLSNLWTQMSAFYSFNLSLAIFERQYSLFSPRSTPMCIIACVVFLLLCSREQLRHFECYEEHYLHSFPELSRVYFMAACSPRNSCYTLLKKGGVFFHNVRTPSKRKTPARLLAAMGVNKTLTFPYILNIP